MDGYGQYPIARGAEIFAARWTPIIVRNMLVGCRTFGEIREGAPGIPRALLTERLRQLERYGIVTRSPNPAGRGFVYELTEAGRGLQAVCDALGARGARWLELAPAHLDAAMVLWSMCRCMPGDEIPEPRMVVRFDVTDNTPRSGTG
jgi:DNA-binding HxlR family transcriptional regulator